MALQLRVSYLRRARGRPIWRMQRRPIFRFTNVSDTKMFCMGITTGTLLVGLLLTICLMFNQNRKDFLDFLEMAPALRPPEEIYTVNQEIWKVFDKIDADKDKHLVLEEMEGYFLRRFLNFSWAIVNDTMLLEENGSLALTPENAVIDDREFLAPMDVDMDGNLTIVDLTTENRAILYNEAKKVHGNYDLNSDGVVVWEEFYLGT